MTKVASDKRPSIVKNIRKRLLLKVSIKQLFLKNLQYSHDKRS